MTKLTTVNNKQVGFGLDFNYIPNEFGKLHLKYRTEKSFNHEKMKIAVESLLIIKLLLNVLLFYNFEK